MAILTAIEKLQIKDEKNILIQGLPSSLEKQFVKLPFSKSVTPLLKQRKIDFACVFAVNKTQLSNILNEVLPVLSERSSIWISFPKPTSKIVTDLHRNNNWECICTCGYEAGEEVALDTVWSAMKFNKIENAVELEPKTKSVKKAAMAHAD